MASGSWPTKTSTDTSIPPGWRAVDCGPTAFVDFDREITGAEERFWGHRVERPEAANGTGAHNRAQFEVNNTSSRGEI